MRPSLKVVSQNSIRNLVERLWQTRESTMTYVPNGKREA